MDTEEPIELRETWHLGENGFWIQRLTNVKTGKKFDIKTPYKDIPLAMTRYVTSEELKRIEESAD